MPTGPGAGAGSAWRVVAATNKTAVNAMGGNRRIADRCNQIAA
jgi:hypothetical protein